MIELLEKYPKAAKVIRQHFLEKLLESLKADLPEEFKEHVKQQGVTDETVSKLIGAQPRALFDVFDENAIYIETKVDDSRDKIGFRYYIIDKMDDASILFNTRKEAEKTAVEEAFKLLEEKL